MKKFLGILVLTLFCSKASAAPTFVNVHDVIDSQEAEPRGIKFNNDGTKMFIVGWAGDDVNEYTLSTAWDVSTVTFVDSTTVMKTSVYNDARDVEFNSD